MQSSKEEVVPSFISMLDGRFVVLACHFSILYGLDQHFKATFHFTLCRDIDNFFLWFFLESNPGQLGQLASMLNILLCCPPPLITVIWIPIAFGRKRLPVRQYFACQQHKLDCWVTLISFSSHQKLKTAFIYEIFCQKSIRVNYPATISKESICTNW